MTMMNDIVKRVGNVDDLVSMSMGILTHNPRTQFKSVNSVNSVNSFRLYTYTTQYGWLRSTLVPSPEYGTVNLIELYTYLMGFSIAIAIQYVDEKMFMHRKVVWENLDDPEYLQYKADQL